MQDGTATTAPRPKRVPAPADLYRRGDQPGRLHDAYIPSTRRIYPKGAAGWVRKSSSRRVDVSANAIVIYSKPLFQFPHIEVVLEIRTFG